MNPDIIARGQAYNARLHDLTDEASEWVADVADVWPGRRNEALRVHEQLQEMLQAARSRAGELALVLAQDVAP